MVPPHMRWRYCRMSRNSRVGRKSMKVVFTVLLIVSCAAVALAADQASATKPSDDKLVNFPGLPACSKGAPVKGDPSKGAAVLYLKAAAGCNIPMHWHTATEDVTV